MRHIRNFIKIWLSGLITAIAINYLIVGFIDIINNIDSLLMMIEKSGFFIYINQFLKGIFGR